MNKLQMYDLTTGEAVGQIDHRHNMYRVTFSPVGGVVASGGNDNRVYFCDAKAGNLLGTGDWQAADITAISYNPDGASVAVGSADRRLKIYSSQTRERIVEVRTPSNVSDLAYSADGTRLFSSDLEGNLRIWDPMTAESLGCIEWGVRLQSIATSPTDTLVALTGYADELDVWDYQAGELLARFPGFNGETLAVSFDPAGSTLAAGGTDDTVTLLTLQ
jgi:WD40 repeat protein